MRSNFWFIQVLYYDVCKSCATFNCLMFPGRPQILAETKSIMSSINIKFSFADIRSKTQIEARRASQRLKNITPETADRRRQNQKLINSSIEQVQKKRSRNTIENMPAEIRQKRNFFRSYDGMSQMKIDADRLRRKHQRRQREENMNSGKQKINTTVHSRETTNCSGENRRP